MIWTEEQQEHRILSAISGDESFKHGGFRVEDNYFKREYEENMKEQGLFDVEEMTNQTELERSYWLQDVRCSEIENDRTDLRNKCLTLTEKFEKPVYERTSVMELIKMELNKAITLKGKDMSMEIKKSIKFTEDKKVGKCYINIPLSDTKTLVLGASANIWLGIATEEATPDVIEI